MRPQYSVWFDATVRHPCGCFSTKQRNSSSHVDISSFLSPSFSLPVGRYSTPPSHPFLRRPAPFFDRTQKFTAADIDIRWNRSVITISSTGKRLIKEMVGGIGENKGVPFHAVEETNIYENIPFYPYFSKCNL